MNHTEQVLNFSCAGEHLLGIVAAPAAPVSAPLGVLIIVGGPQYRAGSHRQFVSLSRGLASAGYPVICCTLCPVRTVLSTLRGRSPTSQAVIP